MPRRRVATIAGKTAQNNAFGVDQDPLLVDVRRGCGERFHGVCPFGVNSDGRVLKTLHRQSSVRAMFLSFKNNILKIWYNNTPQNAQGNGATFQKIFTFVAQNLTLYAPFGGYLEIRK